MSLVPLPIEHLMPVGYPMNRGARYYLCMTAWENLQRPRRAARDAGAARFAHSRGCPREVELLGDGHEVAPPELLTLR